MKYWNKRHRVRNRLWTKIVQVPPSRRYVEIGFLTQDMKRWCQQQPGGRFYFREEWGTYQQPIYSIIWWFERPADATLFALHCL